MTSEAEDGNVFGDDQGRCFVRGGTLFGVRRTRGARLGRRGCRCCMGNAAGFGNLPPTGNSPQDGGFSRHFRDTNKRKTSALIFAAIFVYTGCQHVPVPRSP